MILKYLKMFFFKKSKEKSGLEKAIESGLVIVRKNGDLVLDDKKMHEKIKMDYKQFTNEAEKAWKNLLVDLPEINKPFVAIYNDGSGAIVSMRVAEDDYIDEDGEIAHSHESLCESCGEWMYLCSSFRFWYQLRGE